MTTLWREVPEEVDVSEIYKNDQLDVQNEINFFTSGLDMMSTSTSLR